MNQRNNKKLSILLLFFTIVYITTIYISLSFIQKSLTSKYKYLTYYETVAEAIQTSHKLKEDLQKAIIHKKIDQYELETIFEKSRFQGLKIMEITKNSDITDIIEKYRNIEPVVHNSLIPALKCKNPHIEMCPSESVIINISDSISMLIDDFQNEMLALEATYQNKVSNYSKEISMKIKILIKFVIIGGIACILPLMMKIREEKNKTN